MATKTPIERFWEKVEVSDSPDDSCAVWRGPRSDDGYGRFKANGRNWLAHRWIYEFLVGSIPEGLEIDHLCRNRACVNVNHHEPVTRAENVRRIPEDIRRAARMASMAKAQAASAAKKRARTHCKHGHEFTPENTHVKSDGRRACRQCGRNWMKAYRAAQKSA